MKIFFDHIQKTGGTSVNHLFFEIFGKNNVSPKVFGLSFKSALMLYYDKTVINGHFNFFVGDSLPKGYVSLTILRDPVKRAISQYCAIRDAPDSGFSVSSAAIKQLELKDLVIDSVYSRLFSNAQAKHFASFFHQAPQMLPPDELLDLAKKGLNQFDLIGITERIGEFAEFFKLLIGASEECQISKVNVTLRRMAVSDLSKDAQELLAIHNQVDYELWRYASTLFDQKTKKFDLENNVLNNISNIDTLLTDSQDGAVKHSYELKGSVISFLNASVLGAVGRANMLFSGEMATLTISIKANVDIDDFSVGYRIEHESGFHIYSTNTFDMGKVMSCRSGEISFDFLFPALLAIGVYNVSVYGVARIDNKQKGHFFCRNAASFLITGFLYEAFEGLVRLAPTLLCRSDSNCETSKVISSPPVKRLGRVGHPVQDTHGFLEACKRVSMCKEEYISIPIKIYNQGNEEWYGEGDMPCFVSYHLKEINGETVVYDGIRTPMPGSILPRSELDAFAVVIGPERYGQYILEITLVQEDVCWFEQIQFKSALVHVDVRPDV